MGNMFKALFSFFKFDNNQKLSSGLPLAFVVIIALFLAGVVFAPGGFAKDPPQINSHYKDCKAVNVIKLKDAKITSVKDATAKDAKDAEYCPVLSHPDVLANDTPQSVCPDIDENKVSLLEPSGLTYDSKNKIWVGVSDNYNDLAKCNQSEYTVFYFDATAQPVPKNFEYEKKDGSKDSFDLWIVETNPLLTNALVTQFSPYDLEGIEYDKGSETFYMTGSMSKHADDPTRDTWQRYKAYRFKIRERSGGGLVVVKLDTLFSGWTNNFRDWITSQNTILWSHPSKNCLTMDCLEDLAKALAGRSEKKDDLVNRGERTGGLNIESFALGPKADDGPTRLLFGLRGPILAYKQTPIFTSFLDVSENTSNNQPILNTQSYINTDHINLKDSEGFGLRGMTLLKSSNCLQGKEIYAVILGPSDSEHDPLEAGLIQFDPGSSVFINVDTFDKLPSFFVGEGIAIRSEDITCNVQGEVTVKALLVDDLSAHARVQEFTYTYVEGMEVENNLEFENAAGDREDLVAVMTAPACTDTIDGLENVCSAARIEVSLSHIFKFPKGVDVKDARIHFKVDLQVTYRECPAADENDAVFGNIPYKIKRERGRFICESEFPEF